MKHLSIYIITILCMVAGNATAANTWGKVGPYNGIWYMSRDYMTLNTTYIFLNRRGLPKQLRKSLKDK